jgi:hypothetical protein
VRLPVQFNRESSLVAIEIQRRTSRRCIACGIFYQEVASGGGDSRGGPRLEWGYSLVRWDVRQIGVEFSHL